MPRDCAPPPQLDPIASLLLLLADVDMVGSGTEKCIVGGGGGGGDGTDRGSTSSGRE
jgi:hypothetical protein